MKSANEILDFAIQREQEAADFYEDLAKKVGNHWMKETLNGFSREELRHKGKLLSVKKNEKILSSGQAIMSLKIADYLVDVEASDNISYQDALILAMKREKAAFRLYTDLASKVEDEDLKNVFLSLAQEEAKHKLHFEVEYDEHVLMDN